MTRFDKILDKIKGGREEMTEGVPEEAAFTQRDFENMEKLTEMFRHLGEMGDVLEYKMDTLWKAVIERDASALEEIKEFLNHRKGEHEDENARIDKTIEYLADETLYLNKRALQVVEDREDLFPGKEGSDIV